MKIGHFWLIGWNLEASSLFINLPTRGNPFHVKNHETIKNYFLPPRYLNAACNFLQYCIDNSNNFLVVEQSNAKRTTRVSLTQ